MARSKPHKGKKKQQQRNTQQMPLANDPEVPGKDETPERHEQVQASQHPVAPSAPPPIPKRRLAVAFRRFRKQCFHSWKWDTTIQVFIFGVLCIYTAYTYKLWTTAHEQLVFANRAYLVPLEANILHTMVQPVNGDALITAVRDDTGKFEQFTVGDVPFIEVVISNSGVTPAFRARPSYAITVLKDFPADNQDLPYPILDLGIQSTRMLGKDGRATLGNVLDHPLTGQEIVDLTPIANTSRPDKFLVIFGTYTYEDIFRTPKIMRFCFFYNWPQRIMSGCPSHNRIDDASN